MTFLALITPRFAHNVGGAIRAASCYRIQHVFYTGDRIRADLAQHARLPREERMKGYRDVTWAREDRFFDILRWHPLGVTPVAVEVTPNAENLFDFVHPTHACYVFGPEDGGIPQAMRGLCHRFVTVPTAHCMNLAAAVYTVLYDRACKEHARMDIRREHNA